MLEKRPDFICFFHFNAAANAIERYSNRFARDNQGPGPSGEGFENIPLEIIAFAGSGKIERKADGTLDIKPADRKKRAEVVRMLESLPA